MAFISRFGIFELQGELDQRIILEMDTIQLIVEIFERNKRQFVAKDGKFY